MNNEASTTQKTTAVAEQGANVAPEKPTSKKAATKKKEAPKTKKAKAEPKPAKADAKPAKAPEAKKAAKSAGPKEGATMRPETRAKVLALISRPKGAGLAELMKATGWQAHSVRGFISGALGTKMGIKVESARREDGERIYSLGK